MPTIVNPTPVTPAVFGGLWVTNLLIDLPTQSKPRGMIHARMLPYDGKTLLALGGSDVRVSLPTQAAATNAILTALVATVQRLSGRADKVKSVQVMANDPSKPVFAQVVFDSENRAPYRINDCFALVATDQNFAQTFVGVMAEIARLKGLQFTL